MTLFLHGGECSFGGLYLVRNSHLWLFKAELFPAATPRATAMAGGLNQYRGPSGGDLRCIYCTLSSSPALARCPYCVKKIGGRRGPRRGYYRNDHQLLTEDDVDEVHFIPMSQGRPEALIVPEISGASGPESQQQHTELTQKAEDDDTDDALLQF
ncbi:unnamed protein product [Schistocephalus solidus]|uniref:Cysteine-rich DPF motif domain-containing protein 1 n=1 Tax=Schistocephalus solidus TaxID=70667 RepID=A0A183T1T0_SCHSO|nr:unnamed protein product [Schistocephalus solidus]